MQVLKPRKQSPFLFSKYSIVKRHDMRMAKENSYPFVKLVPTFQHTYIFGFEYF